MFGKFLQSSIDWMDKNPDRTTKERIVLVYAWNEFGEGGYIAPTKGDPEGNYLRALKEVILPTGATIRRQSLTRSSASCSAIASHWRAIVFESTPRAGTNAGPGVGILRRHRCRG